jgi:undecaprenyl-diphosphatase
MHSIIQSIILGIIQGLTEFLPISSTAHLRIFPALFNWNDPGTAFSAVIQLGTMFSVVLYFWKDLSEIYGALLNDLILWCRGKGTLSLQKQESKTAFWILLGTVPICVFGLLFKKPIEEGIVRNLNIISFYLIFFGILLFFSELVARQSRSISKINILDVILLGLAQSFALIPGVSRSGVTIFAGLLLGFKRPDAARFSFLLSVPAVLVSSLLELNTLFQAVKVSSENIIWTNLLVGIMCAFISGYFSIHFLLKYLETNKTNIFVVYRVLLGALVIYLNYKGAIH